MRCHWCKAEWQRLLMAAGAGLLLAFAFPKIGIAGLGWLAPGLLLGAGLGTNRWASFRVGYVGGFAHFLCALYWLLLIPVPVAPVVGWLLLGAFLALFSGGWVWCCWKFHPAAKPARAPDPDAEEFSWKACGGWLDGLLIPSWAQRQVWALGCAATWVTWEMIQARIFSGFPWNLLGASQYELLPLIQVSSITGVYGVSFLLVWFSVSLLNSTAVLARQPARRSGALLEVMAPVLVVAVAMALGARALFAPQPEMRQVRMGLVQPSIPQTMIWNPGESASRFQQLLKLSEQALQEKPQVLLWPEAAVPSMFRWDTNRHGGKTIYEAVTGLARAHGVWLILGADDAEPSKTDPERADYFNSSFLINPEGRVAANYRKRRLVIFGEYVPLARWLPFLKDFTGVHGEFTPGIEPVNFALPELDLVTSVLICFEDIFPHYTREYVGTNTDLLVNLTNNGWFGESAAQWQHAANAVFRAVENRVPLVRCANNGLSCWVDAYGRMYNVYFPGSKDVYRAGYKIVEVKFPAKPRSDATFYSRYGDVFGWGCVALSALLLFGRKFSRR